MKVIAIKTPIVQPGDDLFKILDEAISPSSLREAQATRPFGEDSPESGKQSHEIDRHADARDDEIILKEYSVLAVSSKIVAISERRVIDKESDEQKDELIEQESEYYLPRSENPYNVSLTITNNILAASAGIDESNASGKFILWPKDPQVSANKIREYLIEKYAIKHIGVILTDSKTTPLRWGVTGIALSYSGFKPLHNLIGHPDLFGKPLEYTQVNIIDNLACAAILEMGESNEQTPLAVLSEIKQIEFVDHNPTQKEIDSLKITLDEDLYGVFLKNAPWKKGQKG